MDVSTDLLSVIFSFLGGHSLLTCSEVSKQWRDCSDDYELWKRACLSKFHQHKNSIYYNYTFYQNDWRQVFLDKGRKNFVFDSNEWVVDPFQAFRCRSLSWGKPGYRFRLMTTSTMIGEESYLSMYLQYSSCLHSRACYFIMTIHHPKDPSKTIRRRSRNLILFSKDRPVWGIQDIMSRTTLENHGFFTEDHCLRLSATLFPDVVYIDLVEDMFSMNIRRIPLFLPVSSPTEILERVLTPDQKITHGIQKYRLWVVSLLSREILAALSEENATTLLRKHRDPEWYSCPLLLQRKEDDDSEESLVMGRWVGIEKTLTSSTLSFLSQKMAESIGLPSSSIHLLRSRPFGSLWKEKETDCRSSCHVFSLDSIQPFYRSFQHHIYQQTSQLLQQTKWTNMCDVIRLGLQMGHDEYRLHHFLYRKKIRNARQLLRMLIQNEKGIHLDFCCDGCGKKHFTGIRYHCTVCPDYDLCEACFQTRVRYPYRYQWDIMEGTWIRVPSPEPHGPEHNMNRVITWKEHMGCDS